MKKKENSTQNKYQTQRARAYEVTSFPSTDCELNTDTCSKKYWSLGGFHSSKINWCKTEKANLGGG